jgi:hypothetical protein
MARIRTIKPEFWGDEKMAPLSAVDRLVFLGLISMADDAGRTVDNIKTVDGFIFPETDESSRDSLANLASTGRIIRYTSESGQKLIQVANWLRHQKVDRPSRYVLPAPAECSRECRESIDKDSRSDLGPTTVDQRPTIVDPLPTETVDSVRAFVAEYDFGSCGPSVEGLIRSSRNGNAVIATLRMHLTGEMGHERGTASEIGIACQHYLANGEPFKPAFFAGFIRRGKRGVERTENRQRNAAESRSIDYEAEQREAAAREQRETKAWLAKFAEDNPERFTEFKKRAEASVPARIAGDSRHIIVEQQIIRLIRDEAA